MSGSVAARVKESFLQRFWLRDLGFNPHPGQVVASLDKTLYDHYICLVASNKQQSYEARCQTLIESLKYGQLLSEWGRFVRNKSVTVVFSYVEDKYGSRKSSMNLFNTNLTANLIRDIFCVLQKNYRYFI